MTPLGGLRVNEIVFICNHCNKTFRSQKSLYNHRSIAKYPLDGVIITGEAMETAPEEAQDVYSSNGHIQNEISHEKYQWLSVVFKMPSTKRFVAFAKDNRTV